MPSPHLTALGRAVTMMDLFLCCGILLPFGNLAQESTKMYQAVQGCLLSLSVS